MTEVLIKAAERTIPIRIMGEPALTAWRESASPFAAGVAEAAQFKAKADQLLIVPGDDGKPCEVLFGAGEGPMSVRALAARLPAGEYRIEAMPAHFDSRQAALAWGFGAYRFDRYKQKRGDPAPRLVVPADLDIDEACAVIHACALARDMVNAAPNHLGPLQIETIAREIAAQYGAAIEVTAGDELAREYPVVHAVGRAAEPARAPRMIEIGWGDKKAPLIAIVGKGVVFDTGGLDIKPSAGMRLMKKDMGGAAHALALARMVMAARLPVRLAVLVPAVENSIGGEAMRPSDVLASRKGLTIEVGNTDAEGRLILADALARAAELEPALTIDMATLTGAARVALGPQVIPFYTDDEILAGEIAAASRAVGDPLWRMPLWAGYAEALDSDVADLQNDPQAWAQAGSVTAALFLKRFAPENAWVHFDIFAWNPKARPGYPVGAEVQAIRALYEVLRTRYR